MARIVTAGNEKFKEMIPYSVAKAEALGYEVDVYDLGGLGFGRTLSIPTSDVAVHSNGFVPCLFKIAAISISLLAKEPLVWIDGDCVVVDKIDELFSLVGDIAVTRRPEREVAAVGANPLAGFINTGVIAFNPTIATADFMGLWTEEAIRLNHEQGAMNSLLKGGGPLAIIEDLPCEVYNNYYFDGAFGQSQENAKIIHYKSQFRGRHPALLEKARR